MDCAPSSTVHFQYLLPGGAANGFFKLDSHFRRDPAASRNQIMNLLPRDIDALCGGDNRYFQLIERVADQLAGVEWIFPSPYFLSLPDRSGAVDIPSSYRVLGRTPADSPWLDIEHYRRCRKRSAQQPTPQF